MLLLGKVVTDLTLMRVLVIDCIVVLRLSSRSGDGRRKVLVRRRLARLLLLMIVVVVIIRIMEVSLRFLIKGGSTLLLLLLVRTIIKETSSSTTRTTKSELGSHGGEGSGHLEDFLALFVLLFLEPSAVVGEFLKFSGGGSNPNTINVEKDALVHSVDEADGVIFEHLDEGAAVVALVLFDVRSGVEDVDARSFNQEISDELDGIEREVEGELGDEDVTNTLALVAIREFTLQLGRGLVVGPGHDVLADTVVGVAAEDGRFSNSVEEEVGDILEEVLHGAGGSTESGRALFALFFHHGEIVLLLLLLLLLFVLVVIVIGGTRLGNHHHFLLLLLFLFIVVIIIEEFLFLELLFSFHTNSRGASTGNHLLLVLFNIIMINKRRVVFFFFTIMRRIVMRRDILVAILLLFLFLLLLLKMRNRTRVTTRRRGGCSNNGTRSSRSRAVVVVVIAAKDTIEVVVRVIVEVRTLERTSIGRRGRLGSSRERSVSLGGVVDLRKVIRRCRRHFVVVF